MIVCVCGPFLNPFVCLSALPVSMAGSEGPGAWSSSALELCLGTKASWNPCHVTAAQPCQPRHIQRNSCSAACNLSMRLIKTEPVLRLRHVLQRHDLVLQCPLYFTGVPIHFPPLQHPPSSLDCARRKSAKHHHSPASALCETKQMP